MLFLRALLKQSRQDFELLVVDDGSTDSTVAIAREYQFQFHSMKIVQMEHAGLSAARAKGLDVASGDICIVLDVDETIEDPNLLQKFVMPFSDPQVAAVGGSKKPVGTGWLAEAHQLDRQFRQKMRKVNQDGQSWLVMGGVYAMRRSAVLSVGGMSRTDNLIDDTDISVRLREKGWKLLVRDDIVVGHPDPITVRGALRRSVVQGERIFYILMKYPKVMLNLKLLMVYTPLWILLTVIVSWKLALLLVVLSFLVIWVIYRKMPSTNLSRFLWLGSVMAEWCWHYCG